MDLSVLALLSTVDDHDEGNTQPDHRRHPASIGNTSGKRKGGTYSEET